MAEMAILTDFLQAKTHGFGPALAMGCTARAPSTKALWATPSDRILQQFEDRRPPGARARASDSKKKLFLIMVITRIIINGSLIGVHLVLAPT